ncbi:MAG: GNAT family N-acetyltransferase [Propionibacteriaceae bacterium]|nr:GNAT family N-acetyltransferase [Propionibacteriaceae bacterium]
MNENTPTIYTDRLVLRKVTPEDVRALFELLSDEVVNQFLPWFPLKDENETARHIEMNFLSYYTKKSAYRYAICLKENNRPIGYVCLADAPSFDLGYALKKEFWHMGIVSEATNAVVERTQASGIPYITATHDVNNPYSGKVMEKVGMTYRYSYEEQWMPKDFAVTFRMYQINFDGDETRRFSKYWDESKVHFVEELENE